MNCSFQLGTHPWELTICIVWLSCAVCWVKCIKPIVDLWCFHFLGFYWGCSPIMSQGVSVVLTVMEKKSSREVRGVMGGAELGMGSWGQGRRGSCVGLSCRSNGTNRMETRTFWSVAVRWKTNTFRRRWWCDQGLRGSRGRQCGLEPCFMVWQPSSRNEDFSKETLVQFLWLSDYENNGPHEMRILPGMPCREKERKDWRLVPARGSAHLWEKRCPTVLATYQTKMPERSESPGMTMSRATPWPGLLSLACSWSPYTKPSSRDPKDGLGPLCSSSQSSHIE